MRRPHALTNTFSGVAGEARVAAELVRCGFLVAKPYWTDDEADLVLLDRRYNQSYSVIPVIIQVKSIQFLGNQAEGEVQRRFIQGLKKKYILRSPAFALAIYRVDTDEMFFIHTSANVKAVYDAQATWNNKHVRFDKLGPDSVVRIALDKDAGIPGDWKIPRDDRNWLASRVHPMVEEIEKDRAMTEGAVEALWKTISDEEESSGDTTE
jgi:hypothetical protein